MPRDTNSIREAARVRFLPQEQSQLHASPAHDTRAVHTMFCAEMNTTLPRGTYEHTSCKPTYAAVKHYR